jgi:hypothetical protein
VEVDEGGHGAVAGASGTLAPGFEVDKA